jgi:hypothetical protein
MRSIVAAAAVCLLLSWGLAGNAVAVGLQAVGKEPCNCDPLVARGIVPDTVNKLKSALDFPQISVVLDRLALDVRTVLSQFGSGAPSNGAPELTAKAEPPEKVTAKPPPEIKPPAKPKKKIAKKLTKKPKAKKKVKRPPRAM